MAVDMAFSPYDAEQKSNAGKGKDGPLRPALFLSMQE
jgi:hypothetical protein